MTDTNYFGSIVKILEIPRQKTLNNTIIVTNVRAQLSQVRKTRIINLVFWGNLAREVANYYNVNDYILIEGYVALENKKSLTSIKITVLKIYPFLLSSNRPISKV